MHAEDYEILRRDAVLRAIIQHVESGATIKLPAFDPTLSRPGEMALHNVGIEPNDFGGTVGTFRYQFEGEEDLLHLIVTRLDGSRITPDEGWDVLRFTLPGVPETLVWIKPGEFSQHFYLGHDELLR